MTHVFVSGQYGRCGECGEYRESARHSVDPTQELSTAHTDSEPRYLIQIHSAVGWHTIAAFYSANDAYSFRRTRVDGTRNYRVRESHGPVVF